MILIDADKLILHLNDYALQEAPFRGESADTYNAIEDCIKAIEEQPTAYSVDKVVEELEEMKTIKGSMKTVTCRKWNYGTVNRAIEIVKQGGVREDVCE